jgi:PAS domain S-box-containing protein
MAHHDTVSGRHIGHLYQTGAERRAVARRFIMEGLHAGERVAWITGLDSAPFEVPEGASLVLHPIPTLEDQGEAGPVSYLFDLLRREGDQATREGCDGFRLCLDATSLMMTTKEVGDVIEDLSELNADLKGKACSLLSQYHLPQISPALLANLLNLHPILVVGTQAYENAYYIPPSLLFGEDRGGLLQERLGDLSTFGEAHVRHEGELLHRIMETTPNGITVVDCEGRITFANKPAERILDLTKSEIVDRTYDDPKWRITDEEGDPFPPERLPFNVVMATGEPVYGVCHAIEDHEGHRILLLINSAPITNAKEEIVGVVSVLDDVTERRAAEKARIRQLERELQALDLLSISSPTSVTGRMFGLTPLAESAPHLFTQLVETYAALLERALAQRIYKMEDDLTPDLRAMAEQLGKLHAGPRDVVELHTHGLRHKTERSNPTKGQAYVEEGHILVLQLMGYLLAYYRVRCTKPNRVTTRPDNEDQEESQ